MSKRPSTKRAGRKPAAKATRSAKAKPARREEPIALPAPKRGRGPTTYDPSFCERVIELGEQRKSKWQIAVALGCSRKSLYAWMRTHEEFAEAIEESQFRAMAWWEDAGQAGLTMKGFNANLYST